MKVGLALTVLVVLSACGKRTSPPQQAADGVHALFTGDADSEFCKVALEWGAHELTPPPGESKTPKGYADDYGKFLAGEARIAPPEIRDAAQTSYDGVRTLVLPIMKKYGYDPNRVMKEGTPEEQKTISAPPPKEAAAQERVHRYESQVCGTGEPIAAEDKFSGDPKSAYCKDVNSIRAVVPSVAERGWLIPQTKAFYTGVYTHGFNKLEADAPKGREADIKAVVAFVKTKTLPTLARYGYDLRKILRDGSATDRFAANGSDPSIYVPWSRNSAYDDQVCGPPPPQ